MADNNSYDRRTVLKVSGGALAASVLAGCSAEEESGNGNGGNGNGNGGSGDSDGGNGNGGSGNGDGGNGDTSETTTVSAVNFAFEPEEVTISVGDTVVWEFESAGHNVVAWPDGPDQVSVPEGEGFGSVDKGGDYFTDLVEEGGTYEHTFDAAGEYTYVCAPHSTQGMVGTVVVEE